MAQKILRALDEHGEALKKMGGLLTRLEESQLKKPSHVEIHDDEEEVEEGDEKDKVKYERFKQFEKLTVETIAMKEKKWRKCNMGGVSSMAPIALPATFKISDAEKFDGTGNLKQRVRRYLSIVEVKGLDEKQTLHAFPLSLTGSASRYYSLDPSKTKVWNELMELFVDQFIFNTMIDVTLTDLETIKQGVGETFLEYMTRWKTKASRMDNKPNEKDQINVIIKNLLLAYNSRLLSLPIRSFGELCDCGTRIEDAINNEQLEKGESKPLTK
ncbi:uncharacterized protein LOC142628815 [Castanea sativa]|uniref:uncharacterized protein LOC142628815 n=1 Tax=Castanea sativa TaxID=21020 RepID=UPI003F64B53F